MCAVSVVIQYGIANYPYYAQNARIEIDWFRQFEQLFDAAKRFDALTGQPDCVDPDKDDWMRRAEQRIEQLKDVLVPGQ